YPSSIRSSKEKYVRGLRREDFQQWKNWKSKFRLLEGIVRRWVERLWCLMVCSACRTHRSWATWPERNRGEKWPQITSRLNCADCAFLVASEIPRRATNLALEVLRLGLGRFANAPLEARILRQVRLPAMGPGEVRCYETFTSMALGLALSSLGRCTIKTPSLNSAEIFSAR